MRGIRLGLCALAALLISVSAPGAASAFPSKAETTMYELSSSMHASAVAFDAAGALWFVGNAFQGGDAVVGRVGPDGSLSEFPVSAAKPTAVGDIAAGPDGAMWFTEPGAAAIARVAPSGEITQFALGPDADPLQIVNGPDGALWFTEPALGRIGRLSTSGEVTEFQFGPRSGARSIVVGPDGALWFTLPRADKIGRLTPAGERAVFSLPRATMPKEIAVSSGFLWFTEGEWSKAGRKGLNKLGRLTAAGRLRQFRVPARFGTEEIAPAPNGGVWFSTGPRGAAIESISPSGEPGPRFCLDEYCTLPPSSLAVAPDGVLWFGTAGETCVYCGGGSQIYLDSQAGFVGRLGS